MAEIPGLFPKILRHFFILKLGPFEFLFRSKQSYTSLLSLGVLGVPWHAQILADQLTLFQPGVTDYAHLITTGTPRFSDLPTALWYIVVHMDGGVVVIAIV